MTLRTQTVLEVTRGEGRARWLERVELLEYYGILQLCALQVVSADHVPAEIWISRDCRDPGDIFEAAYQWTLGRGATPAQGELLAAQCRAALAAWGYELGQDLGPAAARVQGATPA